MADSLYLENISFGFGEKPLFRDFSLTLGEENPIVLLGPSGCGKTTLLRLMAGLLEPQSGRVVSPAETGVSFVFQEPRLLPWLTVWENLLLPVKKVLPLKEAETRAGHILESVCLNEKRSSYPDALSGGQRQRASIARGFIYPSRLMLMDEPFQSLDIPLRIELMELTLTLLEKEPRLLIAVTHDPREALFLGRRIVVLGAPGEGVVFDEPNPSGRVYAAPETSGLENRLIRVLRGNA